MTKPRRTALDEARCPAASLPTTYRREPRQCEKRVPNGARLCAHHLSVPAERMTLWAKEKR
jgi:hypothetical protein